MAFSGSRGFSMFLLVLVGSQCSHTFSVVLACSQWFS